MSTLDLMRAERAALESVLADQLPADTRKLWDEARESEMAVDATPSKTFPGRPLKDPIPSGTWATTTACNRLTAMLMLYAGGQQVRPEKIATFGDLIQPDYVDLIVPGPWARYARSSKVEWLRSCRIMAQRMFGEDAPWLGKAANRVAQEEPSVPDPERQRTRNEYLDAALQMSPQHRIAKPYDAQSALMSRHAATNGIFAALGGRRSELSALSLFEVKIVDDRVTVQVLSVAGKTRTQQVRKMPQVAGELLLDYIQYGRPILLGSGTGQPTNALWISVDGKPLTHYGVMASLAEPLRAILGVTANANMMRRAMADRTDILQVDIGNHLAQHGPEGEERYQSRSRPEAVRANQDVLARKYDNLK